MRRLFFQVIAFNLLVSMLALSALPAGAAAKGDSVVKVCGASACMRTDDPGIVGALHSTFAPTSAPAPAPFYLVTFGDAHREVWSYIYVPSIRAMRSDAFGRGPTRWQDASLIRTSLPDLMRLAPNPASKTWRTPAGQQPEVPWVPLPTAAANAEGAQGCGASACVDTDAPKAGGDSEWGWALSAAVAAVLLAAGVAFLRSAKGSPRRNRVSPSTASRGSSCR